MHPTHSYRVLVAHGDYDDAGKRELIGLKAAGPFHACRAAIHVTGARSVVEVYRQDGTTTRGQRRPAKRVRR